MEKIYVTYKDGVKATFEGTDLSERWSDICNDPNAVYGDYYRPGKTKQVLKAYFGQIKTTLPIS